MNELNSTKSQNRNDLQGTSWAPPKKQRRSPASYVWRSGRMFSPQMLPMQPQDLVRAGHITARPSVRQLAYFDSVCSQYCTGACTGQHKKHSRLSVTHYASIPYLPTTTSKTGRPILASLVGPNDRYGVLSSSGVYSLKTLLALQPAAFLQSAYTLRMSRNGHIVNRGNEFVPTMTSALINVQARTSR
ncbi:uncharacterized protein BCR38DRAFT_87569 [Pseudomassariella vexata]|uniref:Uncharacterized protein n=1 Tax=Pseudomassariella vexata TaxID=1141098 RepID=A0A1Y2ED84_9PEZI|nr:uncharacterized protein BCR38DRAFT_87569 [Pseudomassariella vexata]ORY69543.1 hypothetical protein BCR38DRAFT_87569 [Pseudomassariella vexata]